MDKTCIFCQIIAGDVPSCAIYEDDEFLAILDRYPCHAGAFGISGHTLIIPKAHIENIYELDPQMGGRLFELAVPLAGAIQKVCQADGMNILQNNGSVAGQSVFHFHMHIIPRYAGDRVNIRWESTEPPISELESLARKIALNL